VEYACLFLGPGEHISPHESVHHQKEDDKSGQLWGKSTVEVKNFIESAGLDYKEAYTGLPDHISVEFEFMQQVTLREEQALSEGDQEGALYCLKMEKKFIEEHLIHWIPVFCEKIISRAELPFYRGMAALTNDFIQFEKEEITKYI
jgi:TorA maturation chaperone TorD